jgi:hypothetical protein
MLHKYAGRPRIATCDVRGVYSLRECNLGVEGARLLAEALRANSTLQGL